MPVTLNTESLLKGYRQGIFPMAINKRGDIAWFSPDPRALIPLDGRFHISHSLRRTLKQGKFQVTFDTDFEGVIRACSKSHGDTWISREMIDGYCELHRAGYAHSLVAGIIGKLAGGLYGVCIGGAFFGESMFHRVSDASKVALVNLVERLRGSGFMLLDTQWMTPHLAQFGTYLMSKTDYLLLLERAVAANCSF